VRSAVETINSQASHMVVLVFANAGAEKQTPRAEGTKVSAVLDAP